MDHSYLPEVFVLSVLMIACRPLFRRIDARVHLWLLGWTFLILRLLTLFFSGAVAHEPFPHWLSLTALELCGLCLLAAASGQRRRILNRPFLASLAVPVLLQAAFYTLAPALLPRSAIFHFVTSPRPSPATLIAWAINLLLLAPLLYLVLRPDRRRRTLIPVAIAFACFGMITLADSARRPELVTAGMLSLLFLNAAYLYLQQTERFSSGVIAATVGLTAWGLEFPLSPLLDRTFPMLRPDHGLMNLPVYLVMAGIVFTLMEEYLSRTERLAMHDPLTDLPNRRLFEQRFAIAMDEARRNRTTLACLVIDVDNFKAVNDSLGHHVGDELLRALAVRLSWHMSSRDLLARTGGDEFTAMLAGVNDEHHLHFIAQAMMSAASVPVSVEGKPVDVRISMGVALSPDHADDVDELRHMADEAMYRAKRRGGDLLVFAGEEALPGHDSGPRSVPAPVLQMAPTRQRRASAS